MDFGFVDKNVNDSCYDVLLSYFGLSYVKDIFDGGMWAYKSEDITFNNLLEYFLTKTNSVLHLTRKAKKFDCCVCLLVNPYYDELCQYLETSILHLSNSKIKFLKKNVFEKLADDFEYQIMQSYPIQGRKFYLEHNCYENSKRMLKIIENSSKI